MKKKVLTFLIDQAKSGNQGAIGKLYEAYYTHVFKFSFFLCNSEVLAEDLTQETLLKALSCINQLKNPESFKFWLVQIAKSIYVRNEKRYRSDHQNIDELDESTHFETLKLISPKDSKAYEAINLVNQALKKLKSKERLAVLLCYLENYSYAEAAKTMAVSEHTIRGLLRRAKAKLEAEIRGYNVDITGILMLKREVS